MQCCENCHFARPNNPNSISCHRYPPTITKVSGMAVTAYFPLITNSAWCGEWHPRRASHVAVSETDTSISSTPDHVTTLKKRN